MADGFILCGAQVAFGSGDLEDIAAKLLDLRGLGFSRAAVASPHQGIPLDVDTGLKWVEFLYSCIASMKPFTIVVVFSGNQDWTKFAKTVETLTITWPAEDSYDDGGEVAFTAGVTDVDISGTFESRPVLTMTVQPSGKPLVTPGTPSST